MKNDFFSGNIGLETIDEDDYRMLLNKRDKGLSIGDITILEENRKVKTQGGFATGFVLGISAGVAFVLCVVVLYLVGIVKL